MHVARGSALVLCSVAFLACGQSREEKRVAHLKQLCQGAVGMTVRDLETSYEGLPIHIAPPCSADPQEVPPLGCPTGPALCDMGFDFPASSDQNVCTSSGCYFTCIVVAAQPDLEAHEQDREATVCGTLWADGLSNPPFYYLPIWVPGTIYQ